MEDLNGYPQTPAEYFDEVKSKKHLMTKAGLDQLYENCLELANKYYITGQIQGLRKLLFCMESMEKEKQILDLGFNQFVYRDDIDFYIDNISKPNETGKVRPIKCIELEMYEREIPDNIVEVINKTRSIFDQMYIVYTDYSGKVEKKVENYKREKDPILFGVFMDPEKRVCIDRFYFLGDWVDEFCDLTLDKLVNETKLMGRNIIRTLNSPADIKELNEYLEKNKKVDDFGNFVVIPDLDLYKREKENSSKSEVKGIHKVLGFFKKFKRSKNV